MSTQPVSQQRIERHNYFSKHVANPQATITRARAALRNVDFDTFVVTGDSGVSLGSILSWKLGKNLVVVRKKGVQCHDWRSSYGVMGNRWVFLDDLIDSGDTLRRVHKAVSGDEWEVWDYDLSKSVTIDTTFAGVYCYAREVYVEGKGYRNGEYESADKAQGYLDGTRGY